MAEYICVSCGIVSSSYYRFSPTSNKQEDGTNIEISKGEIIHTFKKEEYVCDIREWLNKDN